MNWLDNIIALVSPRAAAERQAYRYVLDEQKNYDAGNNMRLNAGWYAQNNSAEMTDRYDRDLVRARARDLERNSDIANSVIIAYKRNIIGFGFSIRVKTPDEELNKAIQEYWIEWCKAKNCDVTGEQPFMQMMRMAVQRKRVDGGILFRKCYTDGGMLAFKLQALEVDEIDANAIGPVHGKDNKVVAGIEYNRFNRIEGFWLRQYDINGYDINRSEYVPAKDVIFLYTKKRPSQIREMSDMAPTMTRIRDANEFMTAISVKERIAACLAVFIKRINPPQIGRTRESQTIKKDYSGKKITPGMIRELNAGDEIQVVNPSGQSSDAAGMIKLHQRMIGAGQGLSYEATSRDMSQSNYSSARQGIIEDNMTYEEDKELIVEKIFDEIYETFVISLWLHGYIKPKDFWQNKGSYLKHEWVQQPKPWIDPQKEANATKIALNSGVKTFQQIAAENGKDWKEQIDDAAEALEYARTKGIEIGGIIYGKSEDELYTDEKTDE